MCFSSPAFMDILVLVIFFLIIMGWPYYDLVFLPMNPNVAVLGAS